MRIQPSSSQPSSSPQPVDHSLIDLLADHILDRLPLNSPFYAKLSQLYQRLKDPQDVAAQKSVQKEFSDQGIPIYEVRTREDFKELLSVLLKKYTLKKVRAFLFGG